MSQTFLAPVKPNPTKRKIACITLDIEADFHNQSGQIALLEKRALFDRYVTLIQKHKAKVTGFLVTSILARYGSRLRQLAQQIPLEYEIHSHRHNLNAPCTAADIRAATKEYTGFTGHMPRGYRAPVGQITPEGWETLFALHFRYDASIYPSYRPGRLGYNYLRVPVSPFRITRNKESLIEFPFGSLSGVRLVFSLSYVKLLGWKTYRMLLNFFPLPDQLLILSHPYDFYFHLINQNVHAWEKPLLSRNSTHAFEIFDTMLGYLGARGYEFCLVSELLEYSETQDLPSFAVETLQNSRSPLFR